jgi:hypothetical protein
LIGALGDGTALGQSITVSKDGRWPLYVPLYRAPFGYTNWSFLVVTNKQYYGSLFGWVSFTNAPVLEGSLSWIKLPLAGQTFYPNGFTNQMPLLGSAYTEPSAGQRALDITNGTVLLQDGNLAAPVTYGVSLSTNNTFVVAEPNLQSFTLRLSSRTGILKGSFLNPGNSNKLTVIPGVILQNQNLGGGFFLGVNQSGSMILEGD